MPLLSAFSVAVSQGGFAAVNTARTQVYFYFAAAPPLPVPVPRRHMTTINQVDLIESVCDALQFISYFHPIDYIRALGRAYEREQSPAAKDAIAQILTNSRMCAEGHRPICQDTGIVNVIMRIGMEARFEGFSGSVDDAVNQGVRRAYLHPDNKLRASVLDDSAFRASSPSRISGWRRFTSLMSGTCRLPSRWIRAATPCTRPARPNGSGRSSN